MENGQYKVQMVLGEILRTKLASHPLSGGSQIPLQTPRLQVLMRSYQTLPHSNQLPTFLPEKIPIACKAGLDKK